MINQASVSIIPIHNSISISIPIVHITKRTRLFRYLYERNLSWSKQWQEQWAGGELERAFFGWCGILLNAFFYFNFLLARQRMIGFSMPPHIHMARLQQKGHFFYCCNGTKDSSVVSHTIWQLGERKKPWLSFYH